MKKACLYVLSLCIFFPFAIFANEDTTCMLDKTTEDILQTYVGKLSREGWPHEKSMVNLLINKQETTYKRKGLIYHFCDTMLQTRPDGLNMESGCFEYDGFRYDPKQSLFMYALCVHTEAKNTDMEMFPERKYKELFPIDTYIEEDFDFNQLREISDQHDCSPTINMQACQFSRFLPRLFGNIMNTYSNMKLATIYGYKYITEDMKDGDRDNAIQMAIEDFSDSYFKPPASAKDSPAANECGEAGVWYLSPDPLEGDKKHCSHPKTNAMVAETIKSTQRLIENITWLKADEIIANDVEICKTTTRNDDIISCAFSSHGDMFIESDWSSFQNVYLNELMYFSLFVDYYSNQIIDKVSYNNFTFGNYSYASQQNYEEFDILQKEIMLHQQAAFQSMRFLSHVYTSYPVHVAMMAYLEDLHVYRKELAKLYTPLNQLYYLFRNVQACQE